MYLFGGSIINMCVSTLTKILRSAAIWNAINTKLVEIHRQTGSQCMMDQVQW